MKKLRNRMAESHMIVICLLALALMLLLSACQPIEREVFERGRGSVVVVQSGYPGETREYAEGYTWYVDHEALRAASLPNKHSLPKGFGSQREYEAYVATLTPEE